NEIVNSKLSKLEREKEERETISTLGPALFSVVLSTTALSELWYRNHLYRWLGSWSNDALDWRSTVERERLACSIVVFFREMEANLDPSSSVLCERWRLAQIHRRRL
ncbi:hypothetical protein HID58_068865, partial [Brassica napus]